ncbi:MAG: hypothetical protein ABEJ07_04685 [Candidatus Nanohaloarchaea archaeon]
MKGELWKGIGIALGALIAGALVIILIGFILYPVIWFYSIYDAYNHVPSSDK